MSKFFFVFFSNTTATSSRTETESVDQPCDEPSDLQEVLTSLSNPEVISSFLGFQNVFTNTEIPNGIHPCEVENETPDDKFCIAEHDHAKYGINQIFSTEDEVLAFLTLHVPKGLWKLSEDSNFNQTLKCRQASYFEDNCHAKVKIMLLPNDKIQLLGCLVHSHLDYGPAPHLAISPTKRNWTFKIVTRQQNEQVKRFMEENPGQSYSQWVFKDVQGVMNSRNDAIKSSR